jgi:hypothetical protein
MLNRQGNKGLLQKITGKLIVNGGKLGTSEIASDIDSELYCLTPEDFAICVPRHTHELPGVSRKRAHTALVVPKVKAYIHMH